MASLVEVDTSIEYSTRETCPGPPGLCLELAPTAG
jgi:hypothetical protein